MYGVAGGAIRKTASSGKLAQAVFLHDEIPQDGVAVRKGKRQVRAGRSWERRAGRIVPQLREALAVHDAGGHVDQRQVGHHAAHLVRVRVRVRVKVRVRVRIRVQG